jgi:hypothetical protein
MRSCQYETAPDRLKPTGIMPPPRETVNWSELPFQITHSAALGIPVPAFASRAREMAIEAIRKLGSHTLFVARIIRDESWSDGPQSFMIHGLYQAWRRDAGCVLSDAVVIGFQNGSSSR